MAELKDIIDAVLRDTVRAQHQTNMYTQMLAESYQQGGKFFGLNLPGAAIGELSLDFRFAVKGDLTYKEEENVNYKNINFLLRKVASECTTLLLKTFVRTVRGKMADYKEEFGFIDTLEQNRPFTERLTKRFSSILIERSANLTDEKSGQPSPDAITSVVLSVADEQILDHEDLIDLFAKPGNEKLRHTIHSEFERVLKKDMDDLIRENTVGNMKNRHRLGSLNVEMDAAELSQLPESAIQQFHIKVYPQALQKNDKEV